MRYYQQALDILSIDTSQIKEDEHLFNILNAQRYCLPLIQELVDKATPTEVVGRSMTYDGYVGNCPYCAEFVRARGEKPYICECGQKLIWKGDTHG